MRYYRETIQKCLPPEINSSNLITKYASYIQGLRMPEPTDAQFGNKRKDMVEIWFAIHEREERSRKGHLYV